MQLNQDQDEAVNRMLEFVRSRDKFFTLEGYAGTGKSTCLQEFVRACPCPVALTAPTNKATKVVERMAEEMGLGVETMTIHKMLGLGLTDDAEERKLRSYVKPRLGEFPVVVVDEASMVNSWLFANIEGRANEYGSKFIFVGDPLQLPPVKEKHSKTFDQPCGMKLTEIMRQGQDSHIIGLTAHIRDCIENDSELDIHQFESNDVSVVRNATFRNLYLKRVRSKEYENDKDFSRVLAWTNKAVNSYNDEIRRELYGRSVEPYERNECVIAASPIMDQMNAGILAPTDTEALVRDVSVGMHPKFTRYKTLRLALDTGEEIIDACAVHPRHKNQHQYHLNELKAQALHNSRGWPAYYQFVHAFADIRPCHSLTVHRSQGSTYQYGFVDADDIMRNRKRKEALQCLYVATSRASHKVVVKRNV